MFATKSHRIITGSLGILTNDGSPIALCHIAIADGYSIFCVFRRRSTDASSQGVFSFCAFIIIVRIRTCFIRKNTIIVDTIAAGSRFAASKLGYSRLQLSHVDSIGQISTRCYACNLPS